MADLGNIGSRACAPRESLFAFSARAQAAIEGAGATAGAAIVITQRSSRVGVAIADDAGDWFLASGLNDGTYWASEVGSPRGWSIVVAGTSVTVTLEEGSGGGGAVVAGYANAWGG